MSRIPDTFQVASSQTQLERAIAIAVGAHSGVPPTGSSIPVNIVSLLNAGDANTGEEEATTLVLQQAEVLATELAA